MRVTTQLSVRRFIRTNRAAARRRVAQCCSFVLGCTLLGAAAIARSTPEPPPSPPGSSAPHVESSEPATAPLSDSPDSSPTVTPAPPPPAPAGVRVTGRVVLIGSEPSFEVTELYQAPFGGLSPEHPAARTGDSRPVDAQYRLFAAKRELWLVDLQGERFWRVGGNSEPIPFPEIVRTPASRFIVAGEFVAGKPQAMLFHDPVGGKMIVVVPGERPIVTPHDAFKTDSAHVVTGRLHRMQVTDLLLTGPGRWSVALAGGGGRFQVLQTAFSPAADESFIGLADWNQDTIDELYFTARNELRLVLREGAGLARRENLAYRLELPVPRIDRRRFPRPFFFVSGWRGPLTMFYDDQEQRVSAVSQNPLLRPAPWGGLPPALRTDWVAVGDFTGEGYQDVLGRDWNGRSWWLLVEHGSAAETFIIQGMFPFPSGEGAYVAFDEDGDGRLDLAAFDRRTGKTYLARNRIAKDQQGVQIAAGAEIAATDARGLWSTTVNDRTESFIVRQGPGGPIAELLQLGPGSNWLGITLREDALLRRSTGVCTGHSSPVWVLDGMLGNFNGGGFWSHYQICPTGEVAITLDDTGEFVAGCCMPQAPGLLVGPNSWVEDVCPPGSVAIGVRTESPRLLCSGINTDLYTLSPARPGGYWGTGYSRTGRDPYLAVESAPEALRHTIGRTGFLSWDVDGCGGVPWGAVLVGYGGSSRCGDDLFATIHAKADPAMSVVARKCSEVVSPFFGVARCKDEPRRHPVPAAQSAPVAVSEKVNTVPSPGALVTSTSAP